MLTPVTIEWSVLSPDNFTPVTGAMTFQLVDSSGVVCGLEDSATGQSVAPSPVIGQVVNGVLLALLGGQYVPLVLLANDDPTTLPVGTAYLVTEQLSYGNLDPWNLTVHHASPTLQLTSQRPIPD